ncbi:MAG: hypothetical protein J2P41_05940 [Blastocatellia bacterium]|nr:hypothetical protein [Blastocatellia bacterium]
MKEEQRNLAGVYKRAAIGLGLVALAWTAALLFAGESEDEKLRWLIPVAAAALSVICFSLYAKAEERFGNKRE